MVSFHLKKLTSNREYLELAILIQIELNRHPMAKTCFAAVAELLLVTDDALMRALRARAALSRASSPRSLRSVFSLRSIARPLLLSE